MSTGQLIPADERHRAECLARARAIVSGGLSDSREVRAEGERRAASWTRRTEDAQILDALMAEITDLRDTLTGRDQLIAAQQETIAALRVELAVVRRRHELTPDVARVILAMAGA